MPKNTNKPPALSRDEARKRGSVGGKKSGEARRRRKAFRELLEVALMMEREDGTTNGEAVVASLIETAINGDTRAFIAIRDTVGEKPVEKVEDKISGGLQVAWGAKDDD